MLCTFYAWEKFGKLGKIWTKESDNLKQKKSGAVKPRPYSL